MNKLLRRSQFIGTLPYKESKHFSEIKEGRFPVPIYRGSRMAFWSEFEINTMLEAYVNGASDEKLYQISRDLEKKRVYREVMNDE